MSHARQQIREAIATIVTGLTTTGANVFQSRVYPMQTADLPGLIVYTTTEETDEDGFNGTRSQRNLIVVIEGCAKASSNVDDVLDGIAEEVETAIFADPKIGGRCKYGILIGTEITLSGEAEKPVGKIEMTFVFMYHIDGASPGTLL